MHLGNLEDKGLCMVYEEKRAISGDGFGVTGVG